ncbi:MAG: ABC transporter substrate-binding protein [Chloroflexi bacterium]|nr:ABC transporter substrate-binding protein [Chloroflexota bacterium]
MLRRQLLTALVAGLAAAMLIAASCVPAAQAPGGANAVTALTSTPKQAQPKRGGVLKVAPESDPSDWDIHRSPAAGRSVAVGFVYEQILGLDLATNQLKGRLAKAWKWLNPTTLEFTVQEGVKYHDLAPGKARDVTAEDLAWNMTRMMTKGFQSSPAFLNVDTVTATGPGVVAVKFKQPDVGFLEQLPERTFPIGAKEVADQDGDLSVLEHGVGTGPFLFASYKRDVGGSLRRNPAYRLEGKPYLDGVEWFVMPDYASRIAAFRTGQIDAGTTFAGDVDAQGRNDLMRSNPGIEFTAIPAPRPNIIYPNFAVKPLDDPRVRKALRIAIDQQEMIDIVLEGAGHVTGPISWKLLPQWAIPLEELKSTPGYRTPKTVDIDEAKRLLSEAGYAGGLTLESHGAAQMAWSELRPLEVAKSQWAKIGVRLNINVVDRATLEDLERKKSFTLLSIGQGGATEAGSQLALRHACKSARNVQGYCNPKVDEFLQKQAATVDPKERRGLFIEIQKTLLEDSPHFWVFWPERFALKQPWVKNLDFHPILRWGEPSNSWLDK